MEERDGLRVTACERCPALVDSRTQIVNGRGATDANLLFVGEAPGEREDLDGEPFVGRSGGILDEVLRDHGIPRGAVRITNCVRCRPPDNRDPSSEELTNCREYLESEVRAVDPSIIVTLGKVPSEHLLGHPVAVTKAAGRIEQVPLGGRVRDLLVCVHPAASLYDPSQRATLERVIGTAASRVNQAGQSTFEDF